MSERILYLVRHGESEFGSSDVRMSALGGQWDPPLGAKGREQASLLTARLLAMPPPVAVYSSPLRRAMETAAAYAERAGLDVVVEDDLAEAYLGGWEGKPFEEIVASDEQILERLKNQEPIWKHAPGSEGLDRFRARVGGAVERILGGHPSGNVVVVCHGGVINAYVAPLLGLDHEMFFLPENASLNSVVVDGSQRRIRFLNDALHLTDPHLFTTAEGRGT